jgi:hypothetical protein
LGRFRAPRDLFFRPRTSRASRDNRGELVLSGVEGNPLGDARAKR